MPYCSFSQECTTDTHSLFLKVQFCRSFCSPKNRPNTGLGDRGHRLPSRKGELVTEACHTASLSPFNSILVSMLYALAESTGEDSSQACCFCGQVSAWGSSAAPSYNSSTWPISKPGDVFDLLPHCRWMSVVHGCPPSVIGPSLLLLPTLGTVCPNMSRPYPLCLISEVASRLSSSGVPSHDFYLNFCSPCSVTVAIFGH